jgi:hypothetical protein
VKTIGRAPGFRSVRKTWIFGVRRSVFRPAVRAKKLGPALYRQLLERTMSKQQGRGAIEDERGSLIWTCRPCSQKSTCRMMRLGSIFMRASRSAEAKESWTRLRTKSRIVSANSAEAASLGSIALDCRKMGIQRINADPHALAATPESGARSQITTTESSGALSSKNGRGPASRNPRTARSACCRGIEYGIPGTAGEPLRYQSRALALARCASICSGS